MVCDLLCSVVVLRFSSSNYEVSEDNGTVTVCMTKDLETARTFTATATAQEFESEFEGMDISNTVHVLVLNSFCSPNPAEDEDFVPATIPFVFPAGTVNTVCEEFQILSDEVALEGNEQFMVELSMSLFMTIQDMDVGFGSLITAANCTNGGNVVVSSVLVTIIDTDGMISFIYCMPEKSYTKLNNDCSFFLQTLRCFIACAFYFTVIPPHCSIDSKFFQ